MGVDLSSSSLVAFLKNSRVYGLWKDCWWTHRDDDHRSSRKGARVDKDGSIDLLLPLVVSLGKMMARVGAARCFPFVCVVVVVQSCIFPSKGKEQLRPNPKTQKERCGRRRRRGVTRKGRNALRADVVIYRTSQNHGQRTRRKRSIDLGRDESTMAWFWRQWPSLTSFFEEVKKERKEGRKKERARTHKVVVGGLRLTRL